MSGRFGYESRAGGKNVLLLDFWLTVARGTGNSDRPSVKVTAGYPALSRNERALNLKVELPIALFETPALAASIKVDHPQQVVTIDATTVAEAVRQVVGMDVDVRVVAPEAT
jgi:hypothetical protein